jgi:transcriptional regulator with XRE-family HTH domain
MTRTIIASVYKTYNFKDKDPVIDELRTMVKAQKISHRIIHEASGVSVSTLNNWFHGATRRPQSATVEAVGRALGFKRVWTKVKKA